LPMQPHARLCVGIIAQGNLLLAHFAGFWRPATCKTMRNKRNTSMNRSRRPLILAGAVLLGTLALVPPAAPRPAAAATAPPAAAALLRDLAGKEATPDNLAAWYPAVAGYSEFSDDRVARSYAWSVFQAVQAGVQDVAPSGEVVDIPERGTLALPDKADPLAAA